MGAYIVCFELDGSCVARASFFVCGGAEDLDLCDLVWDSSMGILYANISTSPKHLFTFGPEARSKMLGVTVNHLVPMTTYDARPPKRTSTPNRGHTRSLLEGPKRNVPYNRGNRACTSKTVYFFSL